MVKRAATPPPAEDEPRYYTVFQPYPLNANWEVREDYIAFARWIAQCIGTESFYALYYKPKARGMVLIGIDRSFKNTAILLGEHRWREFLRQPTREESPRVSQVFHSTYNSDRQAQKDGWKRIDIKDAWFQESNKDIVSPYPATHWCPVPPEDKTNKPLCRPLPKDVKPAPPKVVPPVVVGSSVWAQERSANPDTPASLRGAWANRVRGARGGPAMTNSTRSGNKSGPPLPSSTPATWNQPIINNASSAKPPPAGAWSKPPQVAKSASQPAKSAWSSGPPRSGSTPSRPPGLPDPPALTRSQGNSTSSSTASSQSSADNSPRFDSLVVNMQGASIREPKVYSAAAEDIDSGDPEEEYPAAWETPKNGDVAHSTMEEEPIENLWGPEEDPEPNEEDRCKYHGFLCTKGICQERAKMERDKERRKKEGDTNENSDNGGIRGNGRKKNGRNRGSNRGGRGRNDSAAPPSSSAPAPAINNEPRVVPFVDPLEEDADIWE
ncbi:hypothetical protein VKT23_000234 [Stygiomarasmius scandens]|uniref:Uncharacterized protein n=1 Tax=Marasmiellus scandens TaxID=2682957 RepID=A0ABR1K674_9AGAR